MSSPTQERKTREDFNYVIKHTFIEAQSPDVEDTGFTRLVHRRTSEPTRSLPQVNYAPEPLSNCTESLPTPSTCLSINGDEIDGDEKPQDRRYSFAGSVDSDGVLGTISFDSSLATVQGTLAASFEPSFSSDHGGAYSEALWSLPQDMSYATMGHTCFPSNYSHGTCEVFSTLSPLQQMQSPDILWSDGTEGEFAALEEAAETRTTVMVRNLESSLTQGVFVQALCDQGFLGRFDFVYMPINFRAHGNFGYAFVNFMSAAVALRFMAHLQILANNEQQWRTVWSTCQGLDDNIERYRNSPLMHELIPMDSKPAIYDGSGARVAFPAPTKPFKKPRIHFAKPTSSESDSSPRKAPDVDATLERRPGRSKKQHQCQASQAYWNSAGNVVVSEATRQQSFGNTIYSKHQTGASPR